MVTFSNYSYEPSLGTRSGAGKPAIDHADVFGIVRRKLLYMLEDIVIFQEWMSEHEPTPAATVHPLSYFDHAHLIESGSIDALITSPPYLNNYHYVRNTRPHLFWLDMASAPVDLKAIEQRNFGRYWQTVRAGPEIALQPPLPHLAAKLEELRSRNPERALTAASGGPITLPPTLMTASGFAR